MQPESPLLHMHQPKNLSSTSIAIVKRRVLRYLAYTFLLILYIHYITLRPSPLLTTPQPAPLDDIPHKIWQIFSINTPIDLSTHSLQTWITKNHDYHYTLVSASGGYALAFRNYADRREILHPFLALRDPMLRSFLLRYMLLESEGGIYSDPDTAALKPVDEWIPPTLTSKVHAVVGIEYDQAEGEVDPGVEGPRLRFCQRIIAASRGHPLISRMVNDVVEGVQALAMEKEMRIAEVRSSDEEVVEFSGSGVWTRAVLETLSEATGSEVSYRNFTEMKEPRFFGDVLVLPVGGFETGQLGEGSLREGSGDALVRHGWKEG